METERHRTNVHRYTQAPAVVFSHKGANLGVWVYIASLQESLPLYHFSQFSHKPSTNNCTCGCYFLCSLVNDFLPD
jgi:hypothetical protein